MTKKNTAEKPEVEPGPKRSKVGILSKSFGVIAVISATLLFAGAYNIGNIGIQEMVSPLAIVPVALFGLSALVNVLVNGATSQPAAQDSEALSAAINEIQSKTTSRLAALQNQLDEMGGQDNEALINENRALREQLETIQQAEREKVLLEAEQLRSENAELEMQIKQWAIKKVDETINQEKAA